MNAPVKIESEEARTAIPLTPSLERRRLRLYLILMVADIVCLLCGFLVAGGIYLGEWPSVNAMFAGQLLLPLFLTIAVYQAAYSINALTDLRFAATRGLIALLVSSALLIFITFYTKSTTSFSRATFTLALMLTACAMTLSRAGMVSLIAWKWSGVVRNVLLIEAGGPKVTVENAQIIDAAPNGLTPNADDAHNLDRLGRIFLNMDRVVVSCPDKDRQVWAFAMRSAGVRGELVSSILTELRPSAISVDENCVSLVVASGPLGLRSRAIKRAFDLVVAGAALLIIWPVMIAAAIAIKLDDGGSILFTQRRLGRGNRFFSMLKFRSMIQAESDADGAVSTARDDLRVTRVGRFLRRTSID